MNTPETIHECPHCQAEVDPAELGGRVYECQMDGSFVAEEGDGNRCPECNKFAAKVADQSCPDCGEPIEDGELEEREVYRSADGTVHDSAEDAEAYDTPEAAAERADKATAAKARSDAMTAGIRERTRARAARLLAALALPTTPPIASLRTALQDPRGSVWILESSAAMVTPAEWLAVTGAGSWDEATINAEALGVSAPSSWFADAIRFDVQVDDLCTLLEALAR